MLLCEWGAVIPGSIGGIGSERVGVLVRVLGPRAVSPVCCPL